MKRLLPLLLLLCTFSLSAQNIFKVDGEELSLKTEVEGKVSLLWNIIDGNYRYFSKKGDEILELTNTKVDGKFQKEYMQVIQKHTSDYATLKYDVNLTLPSLRKFYTEYNTALDPSFVGEASPQGLETRLGLFAGMTNYPYFVNPNNSFLPQLGVDFEVIDNARLRRHGIVFQFRQLFSTSDHDISSSQLTLNYRFKFIKSETFDLFLNTKIAGYNYLSHNISDPDGDGNTTDAITGSGGEFQAPFAFGLGADIALGKGFITLGMYDVFALNLEDNGDFPIDVVLGYKLRL